jgi:hypothetical protein
MVVTTGAVVEVEEVVGDEEEERMRRRQGWSQEAMPAPLPLGRTLPVRMPTVMVVDDIGVSECYFFSSPS